MDFLKSVSYPTQCKMKLLIDTDRGVISGMGGSGLDCGLVPGFGFGFGVEAECRVQAWRRAAVGCQVSL